MMSARIRTATFLFLLLGWIPIFGQDLAQLKDRASKLWEFRVQSKKIDALQLIEPETRETYLQLNETPILSFKVFGLEFTDDPNRIDVFMKVRSVIANVGETDRIVRETWVWKDGQWLMHAVPVKSMFDSDAD